MFLKIDFFNYKIFQNITEFFAKVFLTMPVVEFTNSPNIVIHSYNCAFDIKGTFEMFLHLKFEWPLNSPKSLQLIVFKLLLHLHGFTVMTLKC